jgi:ABC-2 type transport system ATP-binding protein
MEAIVVNNLTKTYGKDKLVAVDNVSFTVNRGEIFGLIGPDGAGKTSLFRVLTTLLLPDAGTATVDGFDTVKDYQEIRNRVGYMPGKFSLYQDLTIAENLEFFATVFNTSIEKNYHLIEDIYNQIKPFRDRRAGQLSGGMKQKLALCCALIHKPSVLFLDEPTTGVDPVSRKEFWQMLQRLKKQGITIVVATPYMDEATLCDRIALVQGGKILSIDTPAHVSAGYPHRLYAVKSDHMSAMIKALHHYDQTVSCYGFGAYAHVAVEKNGKVREADLMAFLTARGMTAVEVLPIEATIEDCFIEALKAERTDV